jgi:UDP-glucose 4-epimerase
MNASPHILVTGGSGFIGTELALQLRQRGCLVFSYDVRPPPSCSPAIWLDGDVRDTAKLSRWLKQLAPSVVFHAAAVHMIPECEQNPDYAHEVNIGGMSSVLHAIARHTLQSLPMCLAHLSSAAVYGSSSTRLKEDAQPQPATVYGHTKRQAEQICLSWGHDNPALRLSIFRLFNVVGVGDHNPHFIPELLTQIAADRQPVTVGDLGTSRDYVAVHDVARILIRACLDRDFAGIVNVGTGKPFTGYQVISLIEQVIGRPITVQHVSAKRRAAEPQMLVADNSTLLTMGLSPEVPLVECLRQLCHWFGIIDLPSATQHRRKR